MKKILFIVDSHSVGGVEKRFSHLFKYLANKEAGSESVVFLVNSTLRGKIEAYRTTPKNNNVSIIFFGFRGKITNLALSALKKIADSIDFYYQLKLIKNDFDLVFFVTSRSRRFRHLFKQTKKKVMVFYGSISSGHPRYKKLYDELIQNGYFFDCLSADIADSIRSLIAKDYDRIFTSPNSFIDYSDTECLYAEKKNVVSFVSRFTKAKGVNLLLDTIEYVLKRT